MTEKIDCAYIQELLSEYIDGDLNPASSHLVREHLSRCQECSALKVELAGLKTSLEYIKEETVPGNLKEKIKARALAEGLLGGKKYGKKITHVPLGALFAATLLIVLTVVFWLFMNHSPIHQNKSSRNIISELKKAESIYQKASLQLEEVVASKMDEMPPGARVEFERNIRIINETIARSREYIKREKNNPGAWEYLLAAYQKKVEFLQLFLDATEG